MVFDIPGIGRLSYDAITHSDFPIIAGDGARSRRCSSSWPTSSWTSPTRTSIRGCATRERCERRAPARARCCASRTCASQFPTEDGVVHAVDGDQLSRSRAARTLGIVGESGSGKTVASLTTIGLTRAQGARISGRILFEGRDLLASTESELRAIRGNEIAMIFQDPLSSLHPVLQDRQPADRGRARAPRRRPRRRARERAVELLGLVGIPDPRAARGRVPARVLGRHAPARDDRDGARQRAQAADRRRADDARST